VTYIFGSPDPRARRIESTEEFRIDLNTFIQRAANKANSSCIVCLGEGLHRLTGKWEVCSCVRRMQ